MKVILLNGPPRVGKDSVGRAIYRQLGGSDRHSHVRIEALAAPMREVAHVITNTVKSNYETTKDLPVPHLNHSTGNDSIREFMIGFSERCIKPRYGKDFWARLLLQRLASPPNYLIITDAGFIDEYMALTESAGIGNVLVVHLSRRGFDWKNDSRGYIKPPLGYVKPLEVNNYLVEESAEEIVQYVQSNLGW